MSRANRGFTLLEFIVALLLSSFLLTAVAMAMRTLIVQSKGALVGLEQEITVVRTVTIMSEALAQRDSLRLSTIVRLSVPEQLTLADGRPHPLARDGSTSSPRRNSTIISIAEPALEHRAQLTTTTYSDFSLRLDGCFDEPHSFDSSTIRSYLALSPWGAKQISGQFIRRGSTCFTVEGTLINGLFFNSNLPDGALTVLYPVRREYSVFVDRSGTLRYVGHVGGRILESQPIVRGLRSISVAEQVLGPNVTGYRASIQPSAGAPTEWIELPLLSGRGLWTSSLT